MDYMKELEQELKEARKRVQDGVAARDFLEKPEGSIIQEWINLSISREMERMTAKEALDDRSYLEAHGAVRVLKDFNVMLQSKAESTKSAQEEVDSINGQIESLEQQ